MLSHITSKEDVSFICADRLQVKAVDETVIDLCARKLKYLMKMHKMIPLHYHKN